MQACLPLKAYRKGAQAFPSHPYIARFVCPEATFIIENKAALSDAKVVYLWFKAVSKGII